MNYYAILSLFSFFGSTLCFITGMDYLEGMEGTLTLEPIFAFPGCIGFLTLGLSFKVVSDLWERRRQAYLAEVQFDVLYRLINQVAAQQAQQAK